jgi:hypothetical protein
MYRRGFFIRFVLALVLLAVLFVGGTLLYRVGWSQGYQAATVLAGSESAEGGALLIPQFRGVGWGPYPLGFGMPFFGLCLGVGFIFLVMFLLGGIFRPWGWRSHHRHWKGGPFPPWAKDWEEYYKKSTRQAGEDQESEDDQPPED